jgi:hypothetical protein
VWGRGCRHTQGTPPNVSVVIWSMVERRWRMKNNELSEWVSVGD